MTRQLVLWLLEQGHQPLHLRPSLDANQALNAALEEAIALRENGQAQLSLLFLQQLLAAGYQSPWIHDNIARVYLQQGQRAQAVSLWAELQNHADPQASAAAAQMREHVQRQLLDGLMTHCSFHGWAPRHLSGAEALAAAEVLDCALQEAISSREAGKPGLSLALMEEAINQGWQSPWLHDNRARALVNLGRREEAIAVWQELSAHSDRHAAALARDALAQQQRKIERDAQVEQANQLLLSGQAAQAETLLLEAWLNQPDDERVLQLLEQAIQPKSGSHSDLLDQELAAVNHRLSVQERLQELLEEVLNG